MVINKKKFNNNTLKQLGAGKSIFGNFFGRKTLNTRKQAKNGHEKNEMNGVRKKENISIQIARFKPVYALLNELEPLSKRNNKALSLYNQLTRLFSKMSSSGSFNSKTKYTEFENLIQEARTFLEYLTKHPEQVFSNTRGTPYAKDKVFSIVESRIRKLDSDRKILEAILDKMRNDTTLDHNEKELLSKILRLETNLIVKDKFLGFGNYEYMKKLFYIAKRIFTDGKNKQILDNYEQDFTNNNFDGTVISQEDYIHLSRLLTKASYGVNTAPKNSGIYSQTNSTDSTGYSGSNKLYTLHESQSIPSSHLYAEPTNQPNQPNQPNRPSKQKKIPLTITNVNRFSPDELTKFNASRFRNITYSNIQNMNQSKKEIIKSKLDEYNLSKLHNSSNV